MSQQHYQETDSY